MFPGVEQNAKNVLESLCVHFGHLSLLTQKRALAPHGHEEVVSASGLIFKAFPD